MPACSIILPTFNRASTLQRAIDSVFAQTCTDWELVVVDDGSTDETHKVLEEYTKRKDSRFHFLIQKNCGRIQARNNGFEKTTSEIITFLDSDDWYDPNHLQNNLALFATGNYDLMLGVPTILGEEYVLDMERPLQKIHLRECAMWPTFFVKRPVFKTVKVRDVPFAEDYFFYRDVLAQKFVTKKISMPTYYYNRLPHVQITREIMECTNIA